ncbi:unnamed protein product, partial [Allacma fusca]
DQSSFLVSIMKMEMDITKLDNNLYRQFKGKKYGGYLEMFNPVLFITDLDLMKEIYIKNFDHFVDRRNFSVEKNDPHLHHTVVNQTGDAWKGLRNKMSPTFTTGKIRGMFTIFNSSAEKLIKALTVQARVDDVVEIRPLIQNLTMDVIASAAFGIQSDLFEDPDSPFAKHAMKIQNLFTAKNFAQILTIWSFPKLAEWLGMKLTDDAADKFLSKIIIDTLNYRLKTGEKREDFLQLMIDARLGQLKRDDESELDNHEKNAQLKEVRDKAKIQLTDDVIIAQSLVFLLGGFDTTESMLTFALYELALNQDVQERLYQEIKESVENNNGEFSYEIINNLEYLDRVVQETLRKYPPATRVDRKCTRPFKLPNTDFVLPKDSIVVLPIYPVHHDPDIWPNPEKFDPERFTKANSANRHPCAFAPFGHGPRNCIGNRFALMEGKTAIAHLLMSFVLESCEKTIVPPVFKSQSPLKPSDNTPLRIRART